jgi:polyhydroxyalkanoate synthase subunit PhaC
MEDDHLKLSNLDRLVRAWQARFTLSISPESLLLAYFDWAIHLANSPGKGLELLEKFLNDGMKCFDYGMHAAITPKYSAGWKALPQDRRFSGYQWQEWPYNYLYQTFLSIENWWQSATTGIRGVSCHHESVVSFVGRQALDMFAPSNFIFTNPEVSKVTRKEFGLNLVRGWFNLTEDLRRIATREKPVGTEDFKVGQRVAITPGKVIYRNRLIELIQYAPATKSVYAEPILIVPAWIMKYYILDLSPGNSLVKYLVDRGHTVFMISWKNPGEQDRDLGMDDYRTLGPMAALDAVSAVVPDQKIHALGYCLGGTLLTIAAAAMARDDDNRLQGMTLLAAQNDFTEAGELMLFIDEGQVSYLEDSMWSKGYLDTSQMAGAFQLLRSNDLIWSRIIQDYLLGERRPMNDLMAWNTDATRMPYRMHSEYLRSLFLNNDLAEGRFEVGGRRIIIGDIRVPIFMVATVNDHVAPWGSVYRFQLFCNAEETTFVLVSGGHNAGIVSEPGHPGRTYRISVRREDEKHIDPETWLTTTPVQQGSWWIPWEEWLAKHSIGLVGPPPMGAPGKGFGPMMDAPGTYVLQE